MSVSKKEIEVCLSKRSYNSLALAEAFSEIMHYRYPDSPKQRPYYCKLCCKYHLTCGQTNLKEIE